MAMTRWQPDRRPLQSALPLAPLVTTVGRGLAGRCPALMLTLGRVKANADD